MRLFRSRSWGARGMYQTSHAMTSWLKVKNPHYSQAEGRAELFEQRRSPESRPRQRIVTAVLLAGVLPSSAAPILQVNSNGILTGATGVDVGGTLTATVVLVEASAAVNRNTGDGRSFSTGLSRAHDLGGLPFRTSPMRASHRPQRRSPNPPP